MLRLRQRARTIALAVIVSLAAAVLVAATSEIGNASGTPVNLHLTGDTAEIKLPRSALPCADGGGGSLEHLADGTLPPGAVSGLGGTFRIALDAHADSPAAGGFLRGDRSHVAISNQRGAMLLRLGAGSCSTPTLNFDGTTLSGSGTWAIDPEYTTDAYRDATGSGTFELTATFAPGGSTPWSLRLSGSLHVLQPTLQLDFVKSYWGRLGSDYAGRIATVVYRVTNTGPGDAFRVRLLSATSTTGITAVEMVPTALDDFSVGESREITVRYKVGVTGQRRGPLLVAREFDTTLTFAVSDALDVVAQPAIPLRVSAPAFPPSL